MEILNNLLAGFEIVLTWKYLLWCFIGVFLGTLIGVLPGLGPIATISMLLPLTLSLSDPMSAILMTSGIYYGAQYGGSTSAILLNIPGETSSIMTSLDGYKMAQQGKAGSALTISALGSFFGGIMGTLIICISAVPLINLALKFGPIEYTSLMFLALVGSVFISTNSFITGSGVLCLGLMLSTVGTDLNSGVPRFTMDLPFLQNGLSFAVLCIGLFGISEIFYNLFYQNNNSINQTFKNKKLFYLDKQDFDRSKMPILRGTFIGSLLGVLPGGGVLLSSIAAYSIEKKIAKNGKKFGTGMIEGVAAPESANNAAAQTSFIPLLTLGIPFTPVMAMILAVMIVNGVVPGPQIMSHSPSLFWTIIAGFAVGNFFLLVLNLPLIKIWVKILSIPRKILYPVILFFCILGAYRINNSWQEIIFLLIPFTVLGIIFKKININPTPLVLGYVIGGFFEEYLRRSLLIHDGNLLIFFQKPISLFFIMISIFLILFARLKKKS